LINHFSDDIVAVLIVDQDVGHGLLDLGKPPSTIHTPRSRHPHLVGILSVVVFPILRELKIFTIFLLIEAAQNRTIAVGGKLTSVGANAISITSLVSHYN
jgi:hypothetical protein